jgi:hypothetical protein
LKTVKSADRIAATPAFDIRSTDPPQTSTTGSPEPSRSNVMMVPSLDVTASMNSPFRFLMAMPGG